MYKQFHIDCIRISLSGTGKQIEETSHLLHMLDLTGNELEDRISIQKMLDSHSNMANVLYDGNTVYPSKSLLAELTRMKKTNSIQKMSNKMYEFLMNFDIAHCDKGGFIRYYDGDYTKLVSGIHRYLLTVPARFTDVRYIVHQHFGYYPA